RVMSIVPSAGSTVNVDSRGLRIGFVPTCPAKYCSQKTSEYRASKPVPRHVPCKSAWPGTATATITARAYIGTHLGIGAGSTSHSIATVGTAGASRWGQRKRRPRQSRWEIREGVTPRKPFGLGTLIRGISPVEVIRQELAALAGRQKVQCLSPENRS